jgi:hypothetical protein
MLAWQHGASVCLEQMFIVPKWSKKKIVIHFGAYISRNPPCFRVKIFDPIGKLSIGIVRA